MRLGERIIKLIKGESLIEFKLGTHKVESTNRVLEYKRILKLWDGSLPQLISYNL